jgi:formylglycine-generating enzyme required for sulfatase activity/predicted Ser/Thr protein kinase
MLSPNTVLRNRYRIIQLLGHGGMGAVYQAIDENLNRLVAVKQAFSSSEELRAAFRREAELLGNLRHRALPKSIEHFSENENDYFVMEYVPGNDLGELLKLRGNPFPESDVLRWADEVLAVLAYLHGKGLVHRDIKPSNIKLTQEGELFLIDFGLAKGAVGQMGTLVTSQSVRGYTPAYASLEQILGQRTDARSDIYSVGATFYHLLAGVGPVDASTRFQKMDDEDKDPLPLIQHENPLVSPHVAGIIQSAMAINRRRRPESAEQMREALRSHRAEKSPLKTPAGSPPPPGPTQPSPTQPSPARPAGASAETPAPIVATMPVSPPTKPAPTHTNRIFALEDLPLEEPKSSGGSFLKPLLIVIGVILLLTGVSVAAVIVKTGWAPWSDRNLYDDGQTYDPANYHNANTSPVVVTSPSPEKPTTQASAAGSVVRNQIGMDLVWIPPGSFMMGSSDGEDDEKPAHQVTISNSFYMSKYEVTQAQWQQVMGSVPSAFRDCASDCPVESVSWEDAQKFIQRLNQLSDGYVYRLPTEAEWEYACRAGTSGDYAGALDSIAWYANNSGNTYFDSNKPSPYDPATAADQYRQQISRNGNRPHPVGTKQSTGFGLFDMAGNVQEWCEDTYHASYVGAPTDGAAWLTGGDRGLRVVRGGAWYFSAHVARSAFRSGLKSDQVDSRVGFRVVAVPKAR